MSDDRQRVLRALRDAGVAGSEDFGRFINNTEYFAPSALDERAAMPVLLRLLPSLTSAEVVSEVARHLRRPWARPGAFDALRLGFEEWAPRGQDAGWAIGDSLACAAEAEDVPVLLDLATDRKYGSARQMVVYSLWRFRKDARVAPALAVLCADPDVCPHAMSAYQRAVGNVGALPLLVRLREHSDPNVRRHAIQQARKAEKAAVR